jgi:hypothetical protein
MAPTLWMRRDRVIGEGPRDSSVIPHRVSGLEERLDARPPRREVATMSKVAAAYRGLSLLGRVQTREAMLPATTAAERGRVDVAAATARPG